MTNNYEKLKDEIATWYPEQGFTDVELNNIANRLIEFCAIGAKILQQIKNPIKDLSTSFPNTQKAKNRLKSPKNKTFDIK